MATDQVPPVSDSDNLSQIYYTVEELSTSERLLKEQCDEIWQQIDETQSRLSVRVPQPTTGTDHSLVTIYKAKTSLLKAQADLVKNTEITRPPQDPLVHFEMTKQELEKSVRELGETLTLVRSVQEELDQTAAKEKVFAEENGQLKMMLTEKLEQSLGESSENSNNQIKDIKAKEVKVNRYCRRLMQKMVSFIRTHFPEPSVEQIQAWRKKQKQKTVVSAGSSSAPLLPLQSVLQDLMNLSVESPNSPYIQLTDAFWPPYIELLLRTGIAERKPDQEDHIRLTPFHW